MLYSFLVAAFWAPAFTDFLGSRATPYSDDACAPRNFLLDENVGALRRRNYPPNQNAPSSPNNWKLEHRAYLDDRVWLVGDILASEPDLSDLPETFRDSNFGTVYGDAHEDLEVLRVEWLRYIAQKAGFPEGQIRATFEAHLLSWSQDSERDVETILHTLAVESEDRPTFAGLAIDLDHLFGPTQAEDQVDWPDRLRDILGLIHYDPSKLGPVEVAIFRYPLKVIRKARGRSELLVGMPTVLDGSMNPAFCPPPMGQKVGFTVDLSGNAPPVTEVIHPTPRNSPDHLFRVGVIQSAPGELRSARALHLTTLRGLSGRGDYAEDTDGDIL